MDNFSKYLKYKKKYLNLKNKKNIGPKNASGVIVFEDDGIYRLVLVVLNPDVKGQEEINYNGRYYKKVTTPGGKIELGENSWDAFKREWKEEVGSELPNLMTHDRCVPCYNYKDTRIYYSQVSNPNPINIIKYNSDNIHRVDGDKLETLDVVFPKFSHVIERIKSSSDQPVIIEVNGEEYILRQCVVDSINEMYEKF
jgi:8-oxo-dGTP pyrophosphatase MutT (NUDIX family)